jgi:phospholipid N-methyltransferase
MQSVIAVASRDVLDPRGEFLVYQFTSRVLPVLRETFENVRRGFEFRNFPPAQFFVARKADMHP